MTCRRVRFPDNGWCEGIVSPSRRLLAHWRWAMVRQSLARPGTGTTTRIRRRKNQRAEA